jgi:hypothetical protein
MNQPAPKQDTTPVQAVNPSNADSSLEPERKNPVLKKKWLITIVLLLLIIPLLISVLSQKKRIAPPQPETTIIATIENQPVYLTDIQKVALEQYQPNAIDREVLRISYDIITERLILDKVAKDLNLNVSDQEVTEALNRKGTPKDEITSLLKKDTRYDLLKNKILKQEVESREAYSIGFYIASYDEQQGEDVSEVEKALFEQQREDGKKALVEIDRRLKEGEIPLTLAKDIYNKYPSLQPILALNGYILQTTTDESFMSVPKLYTYEKENVGQPFFDAIYTMKINQITAINEDDGSGGYVIMMIGVNHASIHNYTDWLAQKKKDLVKQNVTL